MISTRSTPPLVNTHTHTRALLETYGAADGKHSRHETDSRTKVHGVVEWRINASDKIEPTQNRVDGVDINGANVVVFPLRPDRDKTVGNRDLTPKVRIGSSCG